MLQVQNTTGVEYLPLVSSWDGCSTILKFHPCYPTTRNLAHYFMNYVAYETSTFLKQSSIWDNPLWCQGFDGLTAIISWVLGLWLWATISYQLYFTYFNVILLCETGWLPWGLPRKLTDGKLQVENFVKAGDTSGSKRELSALNIQAIAP